MRAPEAPGRPPPLVVATGFLTRLPLGRRSQLDPSEFASAAVFFPLVGAGIGAALAGVAFGLATLLPALLAATLAVAVEVAITGALHVDGLADSADGLAGRTPERSLEIMRDHALGVYGASALALNFLAKVVALATVILGGDLLLWVVAIFAISRAAPLPLAAALPYARSAGGVGRPLADGLRKGAAGAGVALALAIAVAALGWKAIGPVACLAIVLAVVGWLARRRLAGVTGDVMGAAIELTATLGLIAASGWAGGQPLA